MDSSSSSQPFINTSASNNNTTEADSSISEAHFFTKSDDVDMKPTMHQQTTERQRPSSSQSSLKGMMKKTPTMDLTSSSTTPSRKSPLSSDSPISDTRSFQSSILSKDIPVAFPMSTSSSPMISHPPHKVVHGARGIERIKEITIPSSSSSFPTLPPPKSASSSVSSPREKSSIQVIHGSSPNISEDMSQDQAPPGPRRVSVSRRNSAAAMKRSRSSSLATPTSSGENHIQGESHVNSTVIPVVKRARPAGIGRPSGIEKPVLNDRTKLIESPTLTTRDPIVTHSPVETLQSKSPMSEKPNDKKSPKMEKSQVPPPPPPLEISVTEFNLDDGSFSRGWMPVQSPEDPDKHHFSCMVPQCALSAFPTLVEMKRHLATHATSILDTGVMTEAITELKRGFASANKNEFVCLFPDCDVIMGTELEAWLHLKIHQNQIETIVPWMSDVIHAFQAGWVGVDMQGSFGTCYVCMWQGCQKTSLTEQGAVKHHNGHKTFPAVDSGTTTGRNRRSNSSQSTPLPDNTPSNSNLTSSQKKTSPNSAVPAFTPKRINLVLPKKSPPSTTPSSSSTSSTPHVGAIENSSSEDIHVPDVNTRSTQKGNVPPPVAPATPPRQDGLEQSGTEAANDTANLKTPRASSMAGAASGGDEGSEEDDRDSISSEPVFTKVEIKGRSLFQCGYEGCGKTFTRTFNLRSHYRQHTGDRPFRCDKCRSSFLRKSDLRRHENSHAVDQFRCEQCQLTFTRVDALKRHMKKSESGISPCMRRLHSFGLQEKIGGSPGTPGASRSNGSAMEIVSGTESLPEAPQEKTEVIQDPPTEENMEVTKGQGRISQEDVKSHGSAPITSPGRYSTTPITPPSHPTSAPLTLPVISHSEPSRESIQRKPSTSHDTYTTSALSHLLPEMPEAELTALSAMSEMMSSSFTSRPAVTVSESMVSLGGPNERSVSHQVSAPHHTTTYNAPNGAILPHTISHDVTMLTETVRETVGSSMTNQENGLASSQHQISTHKNKEYMPISNADSFVSSSNATHPSPIPTVPLSSFQRLAAELEAAQSKLQTFIMPHQDILGRYLCNSLKTITVVVSSNHIDYFQHIHTPIRWINPFSFYFRIAPHQELLGLYDPTHSCLKFVTSGAIGSTRLSASFSKVEEHHHHSNASQPSQSSKSGAGPDPGVHMGVVDGLVPIRTDTTFQLTRIKLQVYHDTVIHSNGMWIVQWLSPMTFLGTLAGSIGTSTSHSILDASVPIDTVFTYDQVRQGYIQVFGSEHVQDTQTAVHLDHI